MKAVEPLGLLGGDLLIYRSIIGLSALALPVLAAVNWYVRGTPSWPQLAIAGAIFASGLVCYLLSRSGRREVAAAMLIGTLWLIATIYAFKSGYGIHSAVIFIYLPCMLYTALFFGLGIASAELALTLAALVIMYIAEEQGLIGGAAQFVAEKSNFNFMLGVTLTSIGTLVAGAVYHRRVEREAARVVGAAEERRVALEEAQAAQLQLETAHADLQALHQHIAARSAVREKEMSRLRRDLDVLREVITRNSPAPLVLATLDALGLRQRETIRRVPLDLSQLAHEAIARLDRSREFPAVRFDVRPGLHADGDRNLVTSLLHHLVGRAARACRSEPDALVRVGGGSRQGQTVFYVSDTGPGMQNGDALDVAALGARHIVEQHGGELNIESSPGGGSTFFFSLPISTT